MKKILSIVIIIACLGALFSCDFAGMFGDGKENGPDLSSFQNAVMNTDIKNIEITALTESDLGDLTATYKISYANDGSATINYSYQKFNEIGEGAEDELISTYTGTVTRKANGTYEGDLPEGLNLNSLSLGMTLDLTPVSESATLSEDGYTLTVKVPKASTSAVFGYAFSQDVDFEMVLNSNLAVSTLTLTFNGGYIEYTYN